MKDKLISDLKKGMKEYTNSELLGWREHVINNPYKGGSNFEGISDDIIKLIEEEMIRRGIEMIGVSKPTNREETDKEKCIRLFGKENPTWNDLVDAGYSFASGDVITYSPPPSP